MPRKKSRSRREEPTLAEQADPHLLYEKSVQNVDAEVEFLGMAFFQIRRRKPVIFREDFCGTAAAACRWVEVNQRHRAFAIDIDADVLEWGRRNNLSKLTSSQKKRLELVCDDVRRVETPAPDIVGAFNFSYWYFKERGVLLDYFRAVHRALAEDGLFFLDVFGGSEAYTECREKTKCEGFTYVWEQKSYEPISGAYRCHIHFKFPDGSRLKRAFTYDWRLWTLPELRDLLSEAGFGASHVYWEGEDDDGEPNGEYTRVRKGDNDPAWIAYLVAEK
ncbi:MAG: class I SAM-dependent methyltransferase [Chromatiales bacterium]|jgi:SAM-dependent methyltransferase|nr:class I SAM-dependent methyltransferase [Chromatiales bacterium]